MTPFEILGTFGPFAIFPAAVVGALFVTRVFGARTLSQELEELARIPEVGRPKRALVNSLRETSSFVKDARVPKLELELGLDGAHPEGWRCRGL
jgi:hypothetical protein